jgi:hypothetical protein
MASDFSITQTLLKLHVSKGYCKDLWTMLSMVRQWEKP